ncbi:FAD-dependent oxidoreductase [Verrucomicrobiota bacterium]
MEPGESHGIPYRCLTPKGMKNVPAAGHSICTHRPTRGSTRVMPVCLAMGEAAGIPATMAATATPPDVHGIDTAELRKRLRGYGAHLPETNGEVRDD